MTLGLLLLCNKFICVYICIFIHTSHTSHTHTYIHTYTYIHTSHTHKYIYTHVTHRHTYTYIHTSHTHTHTHIHIDSTFGFPSGAVVKSMPANAGDERDVGLIPGPWVKTLWSRKKQPTPVFLSGKFHEQRSLEGYSSWGHKQLDMTKHTHTQDVCLIPSGLLN